MTIAGMKDSKVTEKVLALKGLDSKKQAPDKDSSMLMTSTGWCLTADVKNEKGKINGTY
jgi:hypothetical protein